MPSLRWKKSSDQVLMAEDASYATRVRITLDAAEAGALAAELRELGVSPGSELRHTVSEQWTLFWKTRDAESRCLLAHPEQELWVATVALLPEHLMDLVAQLEAPAISGSELVLSERFALSSVSNLDLTFVFA